MPATSPSTETLEPPECQSMRITQAGKMKPYITFALKHLKENPKTPLAIHTSPLPHNPSKAPAVVPPDDPAKADPLPQSLLTIPRLISLVEIIKREYVAMDLGIGLWQYNESLLVENGVVEGVEKGDGKGKGKEKGKEKATSGDEVDVAAREKEEKEREVLMKLLESKKSLKMRHHPYMKITLSTYPLPALAAKRNVTYQPVLTLRKNKKKRKRPNQAADKRVNSGGEGGMAGAADKTTTGTGDAMDI